MTAVQQTLVSKEAACGNAGFWTRFAATLIDGVIIYIGVLAASRLGVRLGLYVPLEVTMFGAAALYSILALRWKGRTIGKLVCGVTVRRGSDGPIGLGRALLRETVGKLLSTIFLLLGFFWVAISRDKRAWHDYLAGTVVVCDARAASRSRRALATVLTAVALATGVYLYELVQTIRLVRSMAPPAGVTAAYLARPESTLVEVSRLGDAERSQVAEWLDEQGRGPIEYAVAKATEYPLVMFGEVHERHEALHFLNELIPAVYRQAGVRCVAMEVCLAEDNAAIERLVSSSDFDRELALEIARHQPFGLWGWKGYWDVFESVWQLNRSIPQNSEKLRVIGLDRRMDMPSVAMLGFEDNAARDCPPWEKLRIFRAIWTIPRALARDAFMAAQIEKEIIEKGQRGIAWVGRNHSIIGCPQPGPMGAWSRMGFMLRQRHGPMVFQIRLHDMDFSAAFIVKTYNGPGPMLAEFLESVMVMRNNEPVGFDVDESPLALVRDDGSFEFHLEPRLGFTDVAAGYVFLAPWRKLTTCEWLNGYISQRMFLNNKPFYQAFGRRAGREIHNAKDANELFIHMDDD